MYGQETETNIIAHYWIYGFHPIQYNLGFFVAGLVYCSIMNLIFVLFMAVSILILINIIGVVFN